jgi:hypothetical protein
MAVSDRVECQCHPWLEGPRRLAAALRLHPVADEPAGELAYTRAVKFTGLTQNSQVDPAV